jgi:hypothetical protein
MRSTISGNPRKPVEQAKATNIFKYKRMQVKNVLAPAMGINRAQNETGAKAAPYFEGVDGNCVVSHGRRFDRVCGRQTAPRTAWRWRAQLGGGIGIFVGVKIFEYWFE